MENAVCRDRVLCDVCTWLSQPTVVYRVTRKQRTCDIFCSSCVQLFLAVEETDYFTLASRIVRTNNQFVPFWSKNVSLLSSVLMCIPS